MNNSLQKFEVISGSLYVSDPYYKIDAQLGYLIKNVRNGVWKISVERKSKEDLEYRVSVLEATYADYCNVPIYQLISSNIRVCSGMAGIFDAKFFKNDNVIEKIGYKNGMYGTKVNSFWHSFCCDVTLRGPDFRVIPYGCVSSSRYGDGVCKCYAAKSFDEVLGVKIVFIDDDDKS